MMVELRGPGIWRTGAKALAQFSGSRWTFSELRDAAVYRKELYAHEALVLKPLADAKVRAYAGMGFLARARALLSPPEVTAAIPAAPVKPKPVRQSQVQPENAA
ncbi:hypothetical protein ASC87_24375 [Rhizobacter sp. Root1221]|nr:hypothetical protein ASC87_24375 [Rhizobacter sp. Root1221]